jgi:hypothetical protein
MDFVSFIPPWLDAFLIAPFRWTASPLWAMWLGSAPLAFYCVLLGEYSGAGLFLLQHRRSGVTQDGMLRYHTLSMQALRAGDKEAYLAANTLAREEYGKYFFTQAAIGCATLWPLPFALGWMALRFEGIPVYSVPGTTRHAGYVFILLILYILLRFLFGRCKRRIPPFARIARIKRRIREGRGAAPLPF